MLVIILSALCSIVSSQPPLPGQSNKGDSLYAEGRIPEAIAEYRLLIAADPGNAVISYNLACAYSIDNSIIRQFDSCFKYLNLAVDLDTAINALMDPDFLPARDDPGWKVFENRLTKMINLKYKDPFNDIEYAKALWKLQAYDQAFFNEIGIAGNKLGMRSSVSSALWRAKLIMSRSSQQELDALLKEKGWPRVKDVGREAVIAAYLVVQHSDSKMQRKYLPDVRKSCEAGEISWERYAMMYDRMCVNENIPQHYGTHTRYDDKTGKAELYPLEDPLKVDQWRKETGLGPLSEYLREMNIIYNPELK